MCAGDRYEPLRSFIFQEMERRNWSLCYMAAACDTSHGTLSSFLNHVRDPTLSFFEKMSKGLGVPLTQLLALGGIVPPEPPAVQAERRLLRAFRGLGPDLRAALVCAAEAMPQDNTVIQVRRLCEGLRSQDLEQVLTLIAEIKNG